MSQPTQTQSTRTRSTAKEANNMKTTLIALLLTAMALTACGESTPKSTDTTLSASLELAQTLAAGGIGPICTVSMSETCPGSMEVKTASSDSVEVPGTVTFDVCIGTVSLVPVCSAGWEISPASELKVIVGKNGANAKIILIRSNDNTQVLDPLNLSGLTSAANVAKDTLVLAKDAGVTSLSGFEANPATVTRAQLATAKGTLEFEQGKTITATNNLEDEIRKAQARGVPATDADLVSANTALTSARSEIGTAQTVIELIDAALSNGTGNGTTNLNTRIGVVHFCARNIVTGADVAVKVTEVAVGVNPEASGTGCFNITGLPINRALRFRVTDAANPSTLAIVLQPVSALVDDIPVNVTVFMWPDIAEGALYMGPDPMFSTRVGGAPLNISGVKVYQKTSGVLVPVAATCAHNALMDVMAVTSDCHTITPGGVAGCERATVSFSTATPITFEVYNFSADGGVSGTCP